MENKDKRDLKINLARMKEAQFVRNLWVVTVEQGTTREDLLDPAFWSLVSTQFRPYDRIEARCDTGTFFAEYLILSCSRTYAKVKELSWISLVTQDVEMTQENQEEFEYRYRGPHAKHGIIRKSDNAVMKDGFDSKEQALDWLVNHKKVVN